MGYKSFSVSVIGESHIKKNIVCQDFSANVDNDDVQIAVVSDGHGDSTCFRSDKGAEFAVKACMEGLMELANKIKNKDIKYQDIFVEKRKREFLLQLAKGIVAKWNMYIINDLKENPIQDDVEKIKINNNIFNQYIEGNEINHIYGATLIAVMVVENFIIALQQGDGKCIFLNKNGDFFEPVQWDERCYMNITTSLCDEDAAESFRFHIDKFSDNSRPIAVFVASDGIEDSYDNQDTMLCFYRTLCKEIVEKGLDEEMNYLGESWLSDMSKYGSADDMSVAGIVDTEIILPFIDKFEKENLLCTVNANINEIEERKSSMKDKMAYLDRLYDKIKNEIKEMEIVANSVQEFKKDNESEMKNLEFKKSELEKVIMEREEYISKFNELTDKYNYYLIEKEKLK